jgi:hypothetical protein
VKADGYWNGATVKYRAWNWAFASALVTYSGGVFTVTNTPTDQFPTTNWGYWLEGTKPDLSGVHRIVFLTSRSCRPSL